MKKKAEIKYPIAHGGVFMVECPTCGKPLEDPTVVCSICAKEIHRDCANKKSGEWYCQGCKKEAKKRSRYEEMAKRDRSFNR